MYDGFQFCGISVCDHVCLLCPYVLLELFLWFFFHFFWSHFTRFCFMLFFRCLFSREREREGWGSDRRESGEALEELVKGL